MKTTTESMKLSLDEYIIDDRIFSVKFSCDVQKCKGACCTLEGTLGAPVLESELEEIKKTVPFAEKYLAEKNKKVISEEGFFIYYDNEYHLNTVEDNDCVFSFYEEGIAKCSIQKAFNEGEVTFVKPVSCQLFPVRVSGADRNVLKYEKLYECREALEKGEEDNVTIFEYVKSGIVREFGAEFYKDLKEKFIDNA